MIGAQVSNRFRFLNRAVDNPQFEVATTLSGTEIVTNGSFASGTTGWTFGTGWSHIGASPTYARVTSSTNGGTLTQLGAFDTSKIHRASFNLVTVTGNEWVIKVEIGGLVEYIDGRKPNQGIRTYYYDFKPTVAFSVTGIKFTAWTGSSTIVGIDNISIQEATATKIVETQQWYIGGIKAAKGNFDAPTEAASDWWVGE